MRLQETYETYYLGFSFALFTVALIMIPSFMRIYAGEFTDANYTDEYLPFLFVAVNVLMYARRTSSQIINFAGTFKQTQWRSIIESVINLTVSLIMVQYIGIYGVLVGTIAALFYRTNDIIIYANWNILQRMPWQTYKRWFVNLACMIALFYLSQSLLPDIDSFFEWCLVSFVVGIIVLASFVVVDSLFDLKSLFFVKDFMRK